MDLFEENHTRRWKIHQFIEDFLMKTYMFRIFQPCMITGLTGGYRFSVSNGFRTKHDGTCSGTIFWNHFLEHAGLLHISSGIPASSMGFKVASITSSITHVWYPLVMTNIAMGNGTFIEIYLLKIVIFHGFVK